MNESDIRDHFVAAVAHPAADHIDMDAVLRGGRRRHRIRVSATLGSTCVVLLAVVGVAITGFPPRQSTPADGTWTPTPVPTSGWSGGIGRQALAVGTLKRDSNGCLVNGPGSVLRWPKGFTGRTSSLGVVEVLNANGQVVARTGHPVHLGGGLEPGTLTGQCLTGYLVFDVESTVPPLAS